MDEYYRAVRALPAWLASPLAQLPVQTAVRIQELRLRTGCAVTFTVQGRQCPASALPGCPPKLAAMRLNALQIEEIFHTLCNGSVHTHERELAEGYLTTAVGTVQCNTLPVEPWSQSGSLFPVHPAVQWTWPPELCSLKKRSKPCPAAVAAAQEGLLKYITRLRLLCTGLPSFAQQKN